MNQSAVQVAYEILATRFLGAIFAMTWLILPEHGLAEDRYEKIRDELVRDRIASAGVADTRVLNAIRNTPRHEFVPERQRGKAYLDMALPIGASQTISSPFIVALMTEALDPQPTDKVLEIGTGSGYQAAVLSPLVKHVYSIEIVEELGLTARQTLKRLDYDNVSTRIGDGFLGWPNAAPFDKIIVTCSPESVPRPLVEQLREGGRMVIPVGERYQQTLYRMTKQDGELVREVLRPTLFVPMTGEAEDQREQQPDGSDPQVVNGDFSVTPADEQTGNIDFVPGWYYGRQVRQICPGDAATSAGQNNFVRFRNETPGLSSHLLQGIPIDGQQVSMIRLSGNVRTENVRRGPNPDAMPFIAISFYDDQRQELGTYQIGPFRKTRPWRAVSKLIRVPASSHESILRIGLFGATGTADFSQVLIETID